jgi:MFS family permease
MASTEPEIKESGILPSSEAPSDIEKGTNGSTEEEKPFERSIPDWQWFLVSVGIFFGALLYGLDTTISASVQGPILSSLGEIEKLAWVGIGFPMGSVSVILLLGWCYAVFGIKYLMIGSVVAFEAGSALCAAAPSMNAMIFGRVIAGIGGAGMYLGLVPLPIILRSQSILFT